MALRQVELVNFRSYQYYRLSLSAATTIVVGPNGSGKTNLLEAIYVLATTKSWRAADRQLVKEGAVGFKLITAVGSHTLAVSFQADPRLKKAQINQRAYPPEKYLGRLQAVLFEPHGVEIIIGPPDLRRRWLNQILATTDRRYLDSWQRYRHLLVQRNRLLKSPPSQVREQIFAWDLQLVELAASLVRARGLLLTDFNQQIGKLYRQMAGDVIDIKLGYQSPVGLDDYASGLLGLLAQNLNRDLQLGFTSLGPHRDDVRISFGGKPITQVASRGEMRTVLLALKLAEATWRESRTHQRPILLFDDVFGELDTNRRRFLLARLKGSQAVITATDAQGITRFLPTRHKLIKLG